MNDKTTDILICGVGGQGVLLASEVLTLAALNSGMDVKKSEVHGMSQRGGSVESHIRYGKTVHSPLIRKGTAGTMMAFEPLEALRYAEYLAKDGIALISTHKVVPTLLKEEDYPGSIKEKLSKYCAKVLEIPTHEITKELGNPRVANVVLLGALSNFIDLDLEALEAAMAARVPPKVLELNKKAFAKGRDWVKENS